MFTIDRRWRHPRPIVGFVLLGGLFAGSARADEVWVAPTYQADFGGVGLASNVFWPVTVVGAVRLAWAVPDNLQTFQSAKVVLIPHSPAGAATLHVFVCPAQDADVVTAACAGPFTQAFSGVANELQEVDVSAMVGPSVGAPGLSYLAVLAYTTPTTTTDHIVGLRFAYTPTAPSGVATLGANTFSGTQTAPAFVGDGSGLTGLPTPPGVATLGANVFSGTQAAPAFVGNGSGLTGLPFPSGAATLGANTFAGTQTIDTGNLDLDASTSTTGNITKNGVPFLHNFGNKNTFLGVNAGNLTTTGADNVAGGVNALATNTTGFENMATGQDALASNTTGFLNTATGAGALGSNISGHSNTASGRSALAVNTTGSANTGLGLNTLFHSTGDLNVAIGAGAGFNATTGSNNIYLGANILGVAGESNTMYLGLQGTQTRTVIAGVRGTTVVGGEPVVIDASGRLGSGAVSPGPNTVGTNEVINDSLTASDLAPDSVTASELAADSVGAAEVAFNYAGSTSEGGAAADLACVGCVSANEVNFGFATLGANAYTATQTINTGNLDLDNSTAATGNITKNGARFLHNGGLFNVNVFAGLNAGNFTMTGDGNAAIGGSTLVNNTTGFANSAIGREALFVNTTGDQNTAIGAFALDSNQTGDNNTAVGSGALNANSTGGNNVAVGQNAGGQATTGFNNIYLGTFVLGVAGESGSIYLGNQGTQTKTVIAGIRGTTVLGGEPVVIDAAGRLGSGAVSPGPNTVGTNEVINDSLTASDLAPDSVTASELAADSVGAAEAAFNYAGSTSEGGAAADLACVGCVSASEVNFAFATPGANTFTATQTINTGNLDLDNSTATRGNLTKNGTPFLHNFGFLNAFVGLFAGNLTMMGDSNVAIGNSALTNNTTGAANSASGQHALNLNTTGSANTATGQAALESNTSGSNNAAFGFLALADNTTGNSNVAIGPTAGANATTGSNNIYVGALLPGVAGESNTTYLGRQGLQTKTFIGGIRGITTVNNNAIPVLIDSAGQLGTVSSSRRFKEDIHDMADASHRLHQLRPVAFRYKQAYGDGSKPQHYGLIAEEVADVFPELAVRDADGRIDTVHYETLNVLLLNELQKQQGELEEQRKENQHQQERIEALEQRLTRLFGEHAR